MQTRTSADPACPLAPPPQVGDYLASMPQDFYSRQYYSRWDASWYKLTAAVPVPTSALQVRGTPWHPPPAHVLSFTRHSSSPAACKGMPSSRIAPLH